jgi:hypothetical protein
MSGEPGKEYHKRKVHLFPGQAVPEEDRRDYYDSTEILLIRVSAGSGENDFWCFHSNPLPRWER